MSRTEQGVRGSRRTTAGRVLAAVGGTVALAGGAAGVLPASAQSPPPRPTLVAEPPCASPQTGVVITGEGYTPGGQVRLRANYEGGAAGNAIDETVTADASGRIRFVTTPPTDAAVTVGVEASTEDVARTTAGAPPEERVATTRFRVTYHGAFYAPWNTTGPARGRPGRRRTLEASGYVERQSPYLYVHYRHRATRRWYTSRVGRLRGECGALKVRFREFAFRGVRPGRYSVRFDTRRRPSARTLAAPGYRTVVVR